MKTQCTTTHRITRTFSFFALCIIFSLLANSVWAQSSPRTVSGVVNSLDGPVLGATVVLKGTNTGVITNENGEFTFPEALNENDVLVVNYLGYETDEVTITDDTRFVKPFLKDIAIVIVAALKTKEGATTEADPNE